MERKHAVVIGGSIAGLLSARVLADHFERVTLLDRDVFPAEPVFRAGVPQGRHLHVLWTRGLEILSGLLPGFVDDLLAEGAVDLRIPRDFLWLTAEGWRERFDTDRMITFSRGLLEWTVRRRVLELPNVTALTGIEATGLLGARNVTGVAFRARGGAVPPGGKGELRADLVVDASGRASKAPAWLAGLGHSGLRETRIDPLLGYASRTYAIPDGFDPGWKALYLQADPPLTRRTGGLFPQEGGRWICSLSGTGRDYPPTTEAGFLDYARNLRSPVLYEAIKDAEPLSPITSFRDTSNVRRRFDRMRTWPEGFVVTGDAVCAFDPIYGQGMSVAALTALELDRTLAERRSAHWFQKRARWCAAGAWLVATGEDRRYTETEGPPVRLHTKVINAYVSKAVAAANVDPASQAALLDVLALKALPTSLFLPGTLARVLTNTRPPKTSPGELSTSHISGVTKS
ncbi:hypothetical protein [Actinocorallia longicatena]|uniref:2-polyprenyl-6-methoxyphenol hydroxylase-like FAD-dependent oxidoreductase n=1 Tax=Actinocorallia longicatena TaxID=111803 RepID=A0ABP6QSC5_9ACTN